MVRSDSGVASSVGNVFGALQLQLSPTSAQCKFFTVSGSISSQFDAGTIPCRGYGSLTGRVTDGATGDPVTGATVSYSGATTLTDSAGSYSLPMAPLGSYALSAGADGYASQSVIVNVGPGQAVTQNFALAPATNGSGSLRGTVTDAMTGSPLANATISYSDGATTTDANGQYSLSGIPTGRASVTWINHGKTTTQDFALSPLPGSVSGQVIDAVTSQPLAGARVSYAGGTTMSDGSGRYSFPSVTEGTYTFTAGIAGYDPQSKTAAVGPGANVNLNFSLGSKQLFSDGFESGTLSAWTTNSGLVVQGTIVHQDAYAAEASSAGGAAAYARENLPGAYSNVYARTYFFVRTLPVSTVNLIGDRTATGFSISRI